MQLCISTQLWTPSHPCCLRFTLLQIQSHHTFYTPPSPIPPEETSTVGETLHYRRSTSRICHPSSNSRPTPYLKTTACTKPQSFSHSTPSTLENPEPHPLSPYPHSKLQTPKLKSTTLELQQHRSRFPIKIHDSSIPKQYSKNPNTPPSVAAALPVQNSPQSPLTTIPTPYLRVSKSATPLL